MDQPFTVRRLRRTALTAAVATVVAIAATGCGSSASTQTVGTAQIVTGQQIITSCFQNYFYNGILPQSSAKANCSACVIRRLGKLGIRPTAGESEADVLTGVRLSSSVVNSLQSACNEQDASAQ